MFQKKKERKKVTFCQRSSIYPTLPSHCYLKRHFSKTGLLSDCKGCNLWKRKVCFFFFSQWISSHFRMSPGINRNLPHILIFPQINWLPASWSGSFGSKWRVRQRSQPCQFVPNILAPMCSPTCPLQSSALIAPLLAAWVELLSIAQSHVKMFSFNY